jgi:GDP-L-fucose synthase
MIRRWEKGPVIVTGGAGFLGSVVVRRLRQKGCRNITVPTVEEYDLRRESDILRLYEGRQATMVIHLAAVVGGIGANRENPGRYFYDNAIMGYTCSNWHGSAGSTSS